MSSTSYARAGLDRECAALAACPKGDRNNRLFAASAAVGELVSAGEFTREEAERRLLDASGVNGSIRDDGKKKALDTIRGGLAKGMANPREIPRPNGRGPGDPGHSYGNVPPGGGPAGAGPAAAGAGARQARPNGHGPPVGGRGPADAGHAPGAKQPRTERRPRIIAEYVYELADRTPYALVIRYDPKDFKQKHWNGTGWSWGKPKGPKIPYRLPELLEAIGNEIFVCEGEKDSDALAAHGFIATTASEGAAKWTPDLNPHFRDRVVYILPHNDGPGGQGDQHADQVARNLHGIAAEVRVVKLPGLPEKGGDVFDWLAAGNDPDDLADLCRSVPLYEPGAAEPHQTNGSCAGQERPATFSARELNLMRFEDLRFVVPGFLTEGCTILAGNPKLGKSWLCLEVALAVSTGGTCLGGIQCEQGDVLYLALEDNKRRLQRRMQKLTPLAKDWPEALTFATEWRRDVQGGLEHIRTWIAEARNPRLVIVDVLAGFRSPRGSIESQYEADYAAVRALQRIASETNVTILIVHHTRKSPAALDPFEEVSGTFGIMGATDAGMMLRRDGQGITLYTRGRDIEESETAVAYDREACRWHVLGPAAEVRRSDERKTIMDALREAAAPLSPQEIADLTNLPPANVRKLLAKMTADAEVQKAGYGAYCLSLSSLSSGGAYRRARDGYTEN